MNEPPVHSIGATVQAHRKAQGITQKQLAAQAGVSERLLRSLEMGEASGIGLEKLSAILGVLGLELQVSTMGEQAAKISESPTSQGEEYSRILKQAVSSWTE